MSRGRRVQWGHPMTVALVAGLMGLVGTIAVAIITSGSSDKPRQARRAPIPARIAIEAVTFAPRPNGGQSLDVRGVASRLSADHFIFAVATPQDAPDDPGGTPWFVSKASSPNANGRWAARIGVDRPTKAPLTVIAVEAPAAIRGPGCPGCRPGLIDTRDALASRGPRGYLVSRRSPSYTASRPD
jgi:hypothetical protein